MDKKYHWKYLKILLVIISLLFSVECEHRKKELKQLYFKAKKDMFKR